MPPITKPAENHAAHVPPLQSSLADLMLQVFPKHTEIPWSRTRKSLRKGFSKGQTDQILNLLNTGRAIVGLEVYEPSEEEPKARLHFLLQNERPESSLRNFTPPKIAGVEYDVTWEEIARPVASAGGGTVSLKGTPSVHSTATARVSVGTDQRLLTIGHTFKTHYGAAVEWSDPPAGIVNGKVIDVDVQPRQPLDASLVSIDPAATYPAARVPGAVFGGPVVTGQILKAWFRSQATSGSSWVRCTVRTPRANILLSQPGGAVLYTGVATLDVALPPHSGDCGGPYIDESNVDQPKLVGMHVGASVTAQASVIAVMLPIQNPEKRWGFTLVTV